VSADQADSRRVLVVCLGNHCRSSLGAAALARHGPPGMEVRSAGLAGKHQGRPAHPAMIQAAAALGYDLAGHLGAQVTAQMLDWARESALVFSYWRRDASTGTPKITAKGR
jgi:protein-tyrosine-phosphatase